MASNVYNPWAVTKYLNEVVQNKFEPGNYWVKSGASIMLEKLLCYITSKNMQQSLWTLIEGKEERLEFEKDANLLRRYDYAPETIQQPLAYLLLHSGYLTVKRTAESYFFKIPNYEVKAEFTRVVGAVLENLEKTGLPYNSHAIDINGCGNFIVKTADKFIQKHPLKQAIHHIINHDLDGLEKLFNSKILSKCESSINQF